jgi:L-threonylcarbamoyladenylate synthase
MHPVSGGKTAPCAGEVVASPFDAAARERIRNALSTGRVMTYPTETSYALGGNALSADLVDAIYRLKGRERGKSLLLLVDGAQDLRRWVHKVPPPVQSLIDAFWPGPLTLVLPASHDLPAYLSDSRGTIAVRWSSDPLVAELLALGGVPLIGTSANLSGTPALHAAQHVLHTFLTEPLLAVDGGPTSGGAPSTVLDTTVHPFALVREGAVPLDAIRAVLESQFPAESPR